MGLVVEVCYFWCVGREGEGEEGEIFVGCHFVGAFLEMWELNGERRRMVDECYML